MHATMDDVDLGGACVRVMGKEQQGNSALTTDGD